MEMNAHVHRRALTFGTGHVLSDPRGHCLSGDVGLLLLNDGLLCEETRRPNRLARSHASARPHFGFYKIKYSTIINLLLIVCQDFRVLFISVRRQKIPLRSLGASQMALKSGEIQSGCVWGRRDRSQVVVSPVCHPLQVSCPGASGGTG